MKITINKTTKTELEVPQCWMNQGSDGVYKLLSEDTCFCVFPFEKSPLISISGVRFNFSEKSYEISEEFFNLKLNETKLILNL